MKYIDIELSKFFFDLGGSFPHWVIAFFATYLIWIMGILVFFVVKKKSVHPVRTLLFLFVAATLAYALNFIIGYLFFRQRPFEALGLDPLIDVAYPKKSFPSDHAAVVFSAGAYIFLRYKKIAYFLIALALFVSIGRVLAGVHYVSDVLAGAVVGIGSALAVIYILEKKLKI
ncbi:phosphatase PAP2 family protein [Patescibacteria group bacterium]|nr:phosphatase PAP2 family protein [Patescibacteria group bacterium]